MKMRVFLPTFKWSVRMDRRSFLQSTMLLGSTVCGCSQAQANWPGQNPSSSSDKIAGCILPASKFNTLSGLSNFAAGFVPGETELVVSTGSKSVDRNLGKTLVRLSSLFGQRPGF